MNTQTDQPTETPEAQEQRIVPLSTAVELVEVGNKSIPKLTFPNGSTILLMPWKASDDTQDPAEILRQWLAAWVKPSFEMMGAAHKDIGEWLQVARYQNEANPDGFYGSPTDAGIAASERIRERMTPVFRSHRR